MLVENQIISIKWSKGNKFHFINKGYAFTQYGDTLHVNVKDLSKSSKMQVDVICDYCGIIHKTPYRSYLKGHKIIHKDSCKNCVGKKCAEITLKKRQESQYQQIKDKCNENGYELITQANEIINNRTEIYYRCPIHGVHSMRLANLLTGRKCPDCAQDSQKKLYQMDRATLMNEISRNGGLLINPNDYENNQKKNLLVKCPECKNEFKTSFKSFVQHGGQVCRECSKSSESMGERRIRHYLEDNGIDFLQEHWFSDCRDIKPLPFDFYIPSKNLIIEFDGRQHFEETNHFSYSQEKTRLHDKIKNDYCRDRNISLLRIPYWKIGSIEKILSNKFNNLHKDIV